MLGYKFSNIFITLGTKKIIQVLPLQRLHLLSYFSAQPGTVTPKRRHTFPCCLSYGRSFPMAIRPA